MESSLRPPGSEALPRAKVIRLRRVFDRTRQQARRLNNRWMTLSYLAQEYGAPDPASVAFLTPKRLGPATVRNKLRRRMREIYRRNLATSGHDFFFVWIARPPAVELPFADLRAKMTELMDRAR